MPVAVAAGFVLHLFSVPSQVAACSADNLLHTVAGVVASFAVAVVVAVSLANYLSCDLVVVSPLSLTYSPHPMCQMIRP